MDTTPHSRRPAGHVTRQAAALIAGSIAGIAIGVGGAAVAMSGGEPDEQPVIEQRPAVAGATFMVECVEGNTVQEPASYTLACADAGEALDALEWSDWGEDTATATGEAVVNTCEPTCADGEMERFPVEVTASDLVRGEASQSYGTLTVRFTDERPEGARAVEEHQLPTVERSGVR